MLPDWWLAGLLFGGLLPRRLRELLTRSRALELDVGLDLLEEFLHSGGGPGGWGPRGAGGGGRGRQEPTTGKKTELLIYGQRMQAASLAICFGVSILNFHSTVSQSTIVACARKQTVDVVLLCVVTLHNIKSSARIKNTDFGTKLPLLASRICHLVAALP